MGEARCVKLMFTLAASTAAWADSTAALLASICAFAVSTPALEASLLALAETLFCTALSISRCVIACCLASGVYLSTSICVLPWSAIDCGPGKNTNGRRQIHTASQTAGNHAAGNGQCRAEQCLRQSQERSLESWCRDGEGAD